MRYLIVAFLLFSSCAVHAGFYAGAQIGQDFTIYAERDGFPSTKLDGLSVSGFSNGVYGGYRFSGEKYFWGAEINFTRSQASFSDKTSGPQGGERYRLSMGDGHGVAFVWGGSLGGADLYGRFGWQITELSASFSEPGSSEKESFDMGGVRIGLGSELPLSERLRLRLDWSYTIYQEEEYDDYVTFDVQQSLFMAGLTFRI
ncbi:MAG: porin family protein [Alcanivorax sp.]|nr:porin family protein [Alcanivorax sp.]